MYIVLGIFFCICYSISKCTFILMAYLVSLYYTTHTLRIHVYAEIYTYYIRTCDMGNAPNSTGFLMCHTFIRLLTYIVIFTTELYCYHIL